MCKTHNPRKIDKCMIHLIEVLKTYIKDYKIKACCCGHGIYPMSIIFDAGYGNWELISDTEIPRKKRFYAKDKNGYYFIPEVIKEDRYKWQKVKGQKQ